MLVTEKLEQVELAEKKGGGRLEEATVCLQLRLGGFGTRQRLDPTDLTGDDEAADMLHVSKDILQSETLTAINKLDSDMRGWVVARSLPSRILRGGIYVIPATLIEETDDRIKTFIERREFLVEKLVDEYADSGPNGLVAQAKERLGPRFFDVKDYPSPARVKASFTVEARYLQIEVPTALKSVSATLYKRELDKARSYADAMLVEARNGLRQQMKELMDQAVARLGTDDEGKPKKFRDSSIKQFEEFLSLFEFRNVAGDEEMKALVDRTRKLVRGTTPEELRKNLSMRDYVRREFEKVQKAVDALPIEDVPERRIVFEDV
jgi:hypothetical protein